MSTIKSLQSEGSPRALDLVSTVERLTEREITNTPAMQSDPALPLYVTILARIELLVQSDPDLGTTEGQELSTLVDAALVYERRWFPELSGK